MNITILEIQTGKTILKFTSTSVTISKHAPNPTFAFSLAWTQPVKETVEIKTNISNNNDYAKFHEVVTTGNLVWMNVDKPVSRSLTGYFNRMDSLITFEGINEITLSFNVVKYFDQVGHIDFEFAMVGSETTHEAIEAAIRFAENQ
ncbi:MAG: hypothetical protein KGI25_10270 [Thaumarchaeota archaeon]|nr:hypothetical protein [Nitrososphaerota archaeon]